VIDSSIVPFIDYVGEDIWLEDVLRGEVTATNATVCMQRTLSEALRELSEYNAWAEKKADRALIVRKASDIERAKRRESTESSSGPRTAASSKGTSTSLRRLGTGASA